MTLQEKCPMLQFADLGDERGKLVVIEGGKGYLLILNVFFIFTNRIRQ